MAPLVEITGRPDQVERLQLLLEAINVAALNISAELSPQRVLQSIVEQAKQVVGARYAALGIGSDPTQPFQPWIPCGIDEATARILGQSPRPVGMLGAVVREGVTVRVPDLTKDPRYQGFPPHHPPMTSFLGVPIRYRGEVIGNLFLTNKIGAAEFSKEDQQAIEMLAVHAAIAYKHAKLYERVQTKHHRLETVLENSPAAIVFIEPRTDEVYENRMARRLFGRALRPK